MTIARDDVVRATHLRYSVQDYIAGWTVDGSLDIPNLNSR